MIKFFAILFIVVPAIEVTLLVASSHWIGVFPTFIIMIATGVIGAYIAKQQGIAVVRQANEQMRQGILPADSILDGICILFGGILLMTPGYVTDVLGLILLLPISRKRIKFMGMKWIQRRMRGNTTIIWKQ
ncbi:FxsA family protein [Ectobacillus sp. sgz5001026]|uniref:FxsA family protein n=1 Tax=Ectobacillus sp. sgz5001026 TaxID=3242473 RepID=UPI0036D30917